MFENQNAVRLAASEKTRFLARTYGWMSLALLISAISAFFTAANMFDARGSMTPFARLLFGSRGTGFIILAIVEIAIVWWLTASIRKISPATACAGFIAYSVINGLTLSSIFALYRISTIAAAFCASAAMFFVMSVYGATTKTNLASAGKYITMALIGIIVASLLQTLLAFITHTRLELLDLLISFVGVIVFTALAAYDAQKVIKTAQYARNSADYKKVSILAALELYLDFINLFLFLLRLFSRRRD